MAVDEAILEGYAASRPVHLAPTLRLYSWSPPALSLGRRQAASHDPAFLEREGLDLVRRPTGGAAVLHEHERTYAVVGLLRHPPFPGGVLETYRTIAAALELALRDLGVDARAVGPRQVSRSAEASRLCFGETSHHEIAAGATKLVGSAQLRRRGAFLQHGSILMRADADRVARAMGAPVPPRGRFAGIEDVLDRSVPASELDRALRHAFAESLGLELHPGELTPEECALAARWASSKYRARAWTIEGRDVREGGTLSAER